VTTRPARTWSPERRTAWVGATAGPAGCPIAIWSIRRGRSKSTVSTGASSATSAIQLVVPAPSYIIRGPTVGSLPNVELAWTST
jgi:hypothetical protein